MHQFARCVRARTFTTRYTRTFTADAYRLALEELKKGINTTYYAKVASTVGDALGPNYAFDAKWQEETGAQCTLGARA
jgi:hypothetical protein